MVKGFILYKIFYGNDIVYLGRTKQPLQNRIRGHLFKKPMHRSININLVTKIEYAEFKTEADMNLYEIYYINFYKPTLNIDDKVKDNLTITLPDVEWKPFNIPLNIPLWEKWKEEIKQNDEAEKMRREEKKARVEMKRLLRRKKINGEISEEDYWNYIEKLEQEE